MSKIESTAADQSRIDMDLKAPIDERIERMQIQGVDRALEKKLLWKLDTRILPSLALMYLFKSVSPSVSHVSAPNSSYAARSTNPTWGMRRAMGLKMISI